MKEKIYISGTALAQAAGCRPPFITQCKKQGLFKGAQRKKKNSYLIEYHKEKCLAILADLDPAKKRKGKDAGSGDYAIERGKLIRAQRRRLEFDEKIKKGLYVENAIVKKQSFTAARMFSGCMRKFAGQVGGGMRGKVEKVRKDNLSIIEKRDPRGLDGNVGQLESDRQ